MFPKPRDDSHWEEAQQVCLVGAEATQERQPLLKMPPLAGGWGRMVRNKLASSS